MVFRYTTGNAITGYGRSTFENNKSEAISGNGVFTGLATSESGAPDWNANVAAGVWRAGAAIMGIKTASTVLAITNASGLTSGQTRYDIITADNANTLAVVEGTAAATAIAQVPAIPVLKIAVAVITVAYGQSDIQDANILDVRVNLPTNVLTLLYYNNTQSSVTPGGAPYEDVQTQAISALDACYAKLIVRAEGYVDHHANLSTSTNLRLCNNTTPVGSDTKSTGGTGATTNDEDLPHSPEQVFVAGTDYVRGTAFTLRFRANKVGTQNATIYCNSLVVIGVT